MVGNTSEIDDSRFFFADDGKTNPKNELYATLDAFYNEKVLDDNSSACRFPARYAWLGEKLNLENLPKVRCNEYDGILKRLNPKSATIVFPSAHINSPASMFGHTFLRINSAYESKLLSYAINYAANANPDETDAVTFALKGLFGGYYGQFSMLPYYDKLKEYRDTEKRDIWEYDLNLNKEEVLKMVRHIWELNDTQSRYFFFTENCSYNMLWLIEAARPSVHLREYFYYEVIPLETIHAAKMENIIADSNYRPSKRTILLKYEELIADEHIHMPRNIVQMKMSPKDIIENKKISSQEKKYILEASTEYLEYSYAKNEMSKDEYLNQFHAILKARASLGSGEKLHIETPSDPQNSHRAIRVNTGFGYRENTPIGFLGIRPAYHDIEDNAYGFLRGTQIEFLNLQLSYHKEKVKVEEATLLSLASFTQRSEFFNNFSWRTKFAWDSNYINEKTNFTGTIGTGYSWGNKSTYTYFMLDPLFYIEEKLISAIGGSIGVVWDQYDFMNSNIEATRRCYDSGYQQNLLKVSQSFRLMQNLQLQLKYDYKERSDINTEETYRLMLNYYF
jgi:hypothetical protein